MNEIKGSQILPGMTIHMDDSHRSRRIVVKSVGTYSRTAGTKAETSCSVGCVHVNKAVCIDVEDVVYVP